MKRILLILVAIAGALYGFSQRESAVEHGATPIAIEAPVAETAGQWRSGQQVRGTGTVSRILSDDNDGSRHQRFILRLSSGRTLLVAHNIDLAPRVASISEGDTVSFYGEYESNAQGGVIHWTHGDPQGQHVAGWLEHNGRRYQ
jgi:hypothetical protein